MQPPRPSSGSDRFASAAGHAASESTRIVRRVGIYELLAELGRGSSATVYLARAPRGDLVALKVLNREDASHPEARERFAREALISGRIGDPGIVRAIDAGEDHGLPYLVMEYVAGVSLRERLMAGALPVPEATRILGSVARAMHAAHGAGVIHRDLKPANILLDRAGTPRVSDFGLARDQYARRNLTRDGDILGTPYYMAPEQVRGEPVSAATDVWALGVLLFECVTGEPAFNGRAVAEVSNKILGAPVPLASRAARQPVPPAIDALCAAALSKDPRRRPSMEALARDLEAIASGSFGRSAPRRSRRTALLVVAAAAVGAALGAAVVALRAPRIVPVDTRPFEQKLDAIAAAASVVKVKLDRAEAEKVALEAKLSALETAQSGAVDPAPLYRMLAEERMAAGGSLAKAVDAMIGELAALPATSATVALRARLLAHRGRFAEIVALAKGHPDCDGPALRLALCEAYTTTGDERGAAILKALAGEPDEPRGIFARARMIPLRSAEDCERAAALFDEAARKDPTFTEALAEEAMVLTQLVPRGEKDFDRALAAANKAVAADPTSPRAYYARSYTTWNSIISRQRRGEPVPDWLVTATTRDLRLAFSLNRDPVVAIYIGKTFVCVGRAREGLPELDAVVALVRRGDPLWTLARTWRGNARISLGDEVGAVDDWLAALGAGPRELAGECRGFVEQVKDPTRLDQLRAAGLERR